MKVVADQRLRNGSQGAASREAGEDRSILDLVHESIFVRDRERTITYWNAAATELYGWSAEEAIGRNAVDLLRCDHELSVDECESALFDTGRWQSELTRRTKSGDRIMVDVIWAVRRGPDGQPVEIIETGRDVTRRRQQEEALRTNELRYRNLFDVMAVSFWEIDFNAVGAELLRLGGVPSLRDRLLSDRSLVRQCMRLATVLNVNAKTLDLFAAETKDQIVGQDIERFWPQASEEVFVDALVATLSRQPHLVTDTQLLDLAGNRIDALFTVAWSPESRRQGIVVLGIVDITQQRAAVRALASSERKYRDLFNYMPIALWQLDSRAMRDMFDELHAAGVEDMLAYVVDHPEFLEAAQATLEVRAANQQTLKLFGAETHEQLLQWMPTNWVTREDWAGAAAARLAGQKHYTAESTIRRVDGSVAEVLFSVAFADPGDPDSFNLVGAIDISDRTAAERRLRDVEREFAHSARIATLGELTASIAHEVNQPLAAIATNGEASLRWLDRDEPNIEEVRTLSARVVSDARRAAEVIAHIRSMASKDSPSREPVDLNALIDDTLQFLRSELQAKRVAVRQDLAANLPPIDGDRTQLQQVLVNLAVNAAHAMESVPAAHRTLSFRSRQTSGRIILDVDDSGPGIAEQDLPRLFDSFFTTRQGGLGIGLSICRTIIEAHGGQIGCENLSQGARFTVSLPI